MCRNITVLRGLEPPATDEEVEAAARQYARKVAGIASTSRRTDEALERAVGLIAAATKVLLEELPERRVAPKQEPPLRRRMVNRSD